ncbi:MAG: peroxiredoxin [Actinomycetota bacterium]|jgi:glutaredoxin/glutathione-dependent peroxiredoxin|nr:peroxiredoxin [Actinomycetota bacterium]
MAISVGDKIPDVKLTMLTDEGLKPVQSSEVLGSGKVVLIGVPGAFTPTCSDFHLPGFVLRSEELKAKGVDTVACVAMNDAFVMGAWGKAEGADDKVVMLADGNGEFTAQMGLEFDLSSLGLGTRTRRYAAIIEDGVVTDLAVEEGRGVDVSSVDKVLAKL